MSKYKLFGIGLLLILGIILLSSCAKPPDKEMQAARDAIASATSAEANMYAPELFTPAQDSLNQAETLIGEKKYGDAKRLALFAKSWADSAASMAGTKKEEMKASAQNAVNDATAKLDTFKKGKLTAKMKTDVKAWEGALAEAKKDLDAGDYKKAMDTANMVAGNVAKAEEGMTKKTTGTKKK